MSPVARAVVFSAVLLAAAPSAAQPDGPPPPGPTPAATPVPAPRERSGWFIGLGLGGGTLTLTDGDTDQGESYGSVAFGLHFGGLLTPRLAIGVAVTGTSHSEELRDGFSTLNVYQNNVVGFAQYWVLERLWLRGGLGSATVGSRVNSADAIEFPGVAFVGHAAYEVMRTTDYSLDVALGLWGASYEGDVGSSTTGTFELQFTWY